MFLKHIFMSLVVNKTRNNCKLLGILRNSEIKVNLLSAHILQTLVLNREKTKHFGAYIPSFSIDYNQKITNH